MINHFLSKNNFAKLLLFENFDISLACFLILLSSDNRALKKSANDDFPVPYGPVKVKPH